MLRRVAYSWLLFFWVPGLAYGQTTTFFQDGVAPTAAYAGTRDVSLCNVTDVTVDPNTNYNSTNEVDGSPIQKSILLKWDISAIAPGTTVNSASIIMDVASTSVDTFSLYECLRPWVASQATWNIFQTGTPWGTPGAKLIGVDRDSTVLANINLTALGAGTITLNAAGVALIQKWVNTPASNHGFIMSGASNTDGLDFSINETGTSSKRPLLRVVHSGATTVNFQNGVSPSGAYSGATDTTIAWGPATGVGNMNGMGLSLGIEPFTSLLSFDLSSISTQATVTDAKLHLNVDLGSATAYRAYEALRAWSESSASWATYDGTNNWGALGGTAATDHGTTILATVNGPAAGAIVVPLSAQGIVLVQQWVNGSKANRGFLIPSGSDFMHLSDRESANAADRPRLEVTYSVPDAGVPPPPDGGQMADAGVDAGMALPPDAGVLEIDAGLVDVTPASRKHLSLGCSCATGAAGLIEWVVVCFCGFSFSRRARRHVTN